MTYVCKICGGRTNADSTNSIVVCDYCGTKVSIPLFTDESESLLYERGNNYLFHGEYDKAENAFNQLLTLKPDSGELYWNLVLCKYGVTYVKDPQKNIYIPTCNRTLLTPVHADENYKKAIQISSEENIALYKKEAEIIDNIQKRILTISKNEKPFDIFISCKETDANGNRTRDSIEAQKLYNKLTEAGYKVFFARITLENKVGTEYEPYIYAALYSSKIMITICSSKENIEAVWVRNEWSRFLSFREGDVDKTIIPLYFDMDKKDLPDEFLMIPSYDISGTGFEDELFRGIKKQIPLPIELSQKRKSRRKKIIVALSIFLALELVCLSIIIPIATINHANSIKYEEAMQLFNNKSYTDAKAIFETIRNYEDSEYMIERCMFQPDYERAMHHYYYGNYAKATWAFEKLGDYEDAAEQKEKAKLAWRKKLARVVTETYKDYCYVTLNGSIALTETKETVGNIQINEHGKIISVAYNDMGDYATMALHEDGTIDNAKEREDVQWQDVIQITPAYGGKSAVLLSNGKVTFFESNACNYSNTYPWQEEVETWEDIVMLNAISYNSVNNALYVLVGIDKDGNPHLTHLYCPNFYNKLEITEAKQLPTFMEHSEAFKNIKEIAIGSTLYQSNYINAVALTKDGKIVSCIDGITDVQDAGNTIDVGLYGDTIFTLSSDGVLRTTTSSTPVSYDIAEIQNNVFIAKSGSIYYYYDIGIKLDAKTNVYDEWLARMD